MRTEDKATSTEGEDDGKGDSMTVSGDDDWRIGELGDDDCGTHQGRLSAW